MTPDDDKPAHYSDDANLEPEREHDAHEPEEATTERAEGAPFVDEAGDTWFVVAPKDGEPLKPFVVVDGGRVAPEVWIDGRPVNGMFRISFDEVRRRLDRP